MSLKNVLLLLFGAFLIVVMLLWVLRDIDGLLTRALLYAF